MKDIFGKSLTKNPERVKMFHSFLEYLSKIGKDGKTEMGFCAQNFLYHLIRLKLLYNNL